MVADQGCVERYEHSGGRTLTLTCALCLGAVRDFSRAQVTIAPAEFASWSDARAELMREAKRPLKAQLDAEMSAAVDDAEVKKIQEGFTQKEARIEHEIDHKPLECHLQLAVSYNFLSK